MAFAAAYHGPIPDLTLVTDSSFATGDRVAVGWAMRDGLFGRGTDYWDRLTLGRRLGHAS